MTDAPIPMNIVYRQADDIVSRAVAGETLLVPIRGRLADLQRLFALNPVAEFIWQQLDGERTLAHIRDAVVDRFDVPSDTAEADLTAFVGELTTAGLAVTKGEVDDDV